MVQEARFQVEEDEEERRRKRKEQKRAKKERKAQEQRETEASGNIGYFVMRTPSVLDNSFQQDEDDNRPPLESRNTPFGQDTDQTSLDRRNSRVRSARDNQQKEGQEITIKDEESSEDEGTQFFDSISTPSDHQRDKSMGVLSDKLCLCFNCLLR